MHDNELTFYAERQEDQFFDRKSSAIKPAKLSQSFSSFANADGGEVFVGMEDDGSFVGLATIEDLNPILQVAAETMSQSYFRVDFVRPASDSGFGLLFTIERHPMLVRSAAGETYQRHGAQNRRLVEEALDALKRSKGEVRYELTSTAAPVEELANSTIMIDFMINGRAFAEPSEFLYKQLLIKDEKSTIAGTLLFSDLPQAHLANSAVKIYRYKTAGLEHRDHLAGPPETIEGPLTVLIEQTKQAVIRIVTAIPSLEVGGFEHKEYPTTTLHEILTNAFLHRDYGISDYVHVRIFDNRLEIDSPGRLHGHVTVQNILSERSARNPQIQRVINKFPDAPNQDIGEGLNSAFEAMESLLLRPPVIEELSDRVRVTISHEALASPQKAIVDAAIKAGSINNSEAQSVTKIQQERSIRRYFEELVDSGQLIRRGSGRGTRYYPTQEAQGQSESTEN
ncbi:ATP-binding protein [Dietzia sp. NPDC055340]